MIWLLGIIAGLFALAARASASSLFHGGQQMIDTKGYHTDSWIPYLKPLCDAHSVPLAFARSSIEEESSGNPCAIGAPGALGPDGNPRELGILQLYNPDDLSMLGVTGNQMRAFCVPGKIQVKNKHGQLVWTHRQDVARLLTDDEMRQQANLAVRKIIQARGVAVRAAMDAGLQWQEIELWRLVKLVHGLPGLVRGVITAASVLGHPPLSWDEYRARVEDGTVKLDTNTEAYRSEYASIFDNAEHATAGMEQTNA